MKLTFAKLDARSIAPGLILITALLLLGAQPASSGDRSIDELQRARDILVRKEQRLQSVHDQTKTSINNLKDQLNSLYQLLDAVDTRLEQTHNSIGEIDKALRSN